MPFIFSKISLGALFSFLWFFLLFLAGLTSSISLIEPAVAFIRDDFQIERRKSAMIVGGVAFILCQPAIFFLGHGVLDELDFWGGTFCLVLFGTIESILFAWTFGIDRAWNEIHRGAQLHIPRVYKWIIKYITPAFLLVILGTWIMQQGWSTMIMENVKAEDMPYVLCTRIGLLILFLVLAILVHIWHKKFYQEEGK
jgi:SNF family Na+-dependent transporter